MRSVLIADTNVDVFFIPAKYLRKIILTNNNSALRGIVPSKAREAWFYLLLALSLWDVRVK